MLYFIEVLRAIAALLIINCHMNEVYPIKALATGSEIGLCLFFVLSGYLTGKVTKDTEFLKWFPKKALKIAIPTLIWSVVRLLLGQSSIEKPLDVFTYFIYPTSFWFATYIILAFVLIFLFKKYVYSRYGIKSIYAAMGIVTCAYLAVFYCTADLSVYNVYTASYVTQVFWLLPIFVGVLLREYERESKLPKNTIACLAGMAVSLCGYFGMKLLFARKQLLVIQYIPFFFALCFTVCFFLLLAGFETDIRKMRDKKILNAIVEFISKSTFEIYIVQFTGFFLFKKFFFPLNFVLIVAFAIVVGFLLHRLTELLVSMIFGTKSESKAVNRAENGQSTEADGNKQVDRQN